MTMLTLLLAVSSIYVMGTMISVSYRLVRISELKIDFDSTRSKDVRNECITLTRHHVRGLKTSVLWPHHVFTGAKSAISWIGSLDSR